MKRFLLACFLCGAVCAQAKDINRPIAQVNNEIITSKDLDDFCSSLKMQYQQSPSRAELNPDEPDFRNKALDRMIEERLILLAARAEQDRRDKEAEKDEKKARYKIEIPQQWIEDQINKAAQNFSSRDEFEKSLAQNGLNNLMFRERLKDQYLMQYLLEAEVYRFVNVSPQEALDYYEKNKSSLYSPVTFKLLTARFFGPEEWKRFNAVYSKKGIAAAQSEFPDVLKEIETTPSRLRKEFADPLRDVSTGKAFDVGIGQDIYFFYVKEKIEPKPMTFEEAQGEITSTLWTLKFKKRYSGFIDLLRTRAYVKKFAQD